MTPLKLKLECENCGIWLVCTYDADVPTKVLGFDCACGHHTPVIQVPGPDGWTRLEASFHKEPQRSIVDEALRKLGDPDSASGATNDRG